ncbi:hypothetical protein B0H13DRAFT_2661285 [Mycena leptocephala]|nr:hypothetical protein B0H13DRAFT_2661285 [Mycena leptocephala]
MSGVIKANSFIQVKSVASQQVNIHVNFSAPRTLGAEWGYALYTPDVPRASDPGSMMLLEKMWLTGVGATALSPLSALLACNVAFEKHVSIHFTLDGWSTTSDVYARYVDAAVHPPRSPSATKPGPGWDRFTFRIPLADYSKDAETPRAGCLLVSSSSQCTSPHHMCVQTAWHRTSGVLDKAGPVQAQVARGSGGITTAGGTTAWVSARCIGVRPNLISLESACADPFSDLFVFSNTADPRLRSKTTIPDIRAPIPRTAGILAAARAQRVSTTAGRQAHRRKGLAL